MGFRGRYQGYDTQGGCEMRQNKILITGGAGFFGHHLVEHIFKNNDWDIVIWDKLTYASNGYDRLRDIQVFDEKRVKIFNVDFSVPISTGVVRETGKVDFIVHAGAETHVDNSIKEPHLFERSNVRGTLYMLDYAKQQKPSIFLYFSTDEVFGPAPKGVDYKEEDRHNPTNPYSASKSSAEAFCKAYANCYGIPIIITRTMNLFGERQHSEKFIPLVLDKVLKGETVTIHADKTRAKAGQRKYIHCRNASDAILFILNNGIIGETYHIVGEKEVDNLTLARQIAQVVNKPLKYEMVDFHSSRPGHDLRYSLSGEKLAKLGWKPPKAFDQSLTKTILWTIENNKWMQ